MLIWFSILCEFGLLFSSLMVAHGATGPPRILGSKQKSYTVNVGDTVKLKCRATGSKDGLAMRTLFFWKKLDSRRVIRSGNKFPRHVIKQGKYLKIKNVQLEDSGKYMCSARNEFGFVNAYRTLIVKDTGTTNVTRRKPTKPTKVVPFTVPMPNIMKVDEGPPRFRNGMVNDTKVRYIEHPVGHVGRLKCSVTGKPTPTISWSKNGIPITKSKNVRLGQESSVLVFKELRKEDSGNYTCVATNKYGSIKIQFLLKVKGILGFLNPAAKKTRNVTGVMGQNLTLTCRTDLRGRRGGLPYLEWVKWNLNLNLRPPDRYPAPRERMATENSKFGLGERIKWVYSSNKNGSLIGKLTLINISASDEGRYTCMAGTGRRLTAIEEVFVVIVPAGTLRPENVKERRINYNVPILILVLVPTVAGILFILAAFCCWRLNRKKRGSRFNEDQPLQEKPFQNGFLKHDRKENGAPQINREDEHAPFMTGMALQSFQRTNEENNTDCHPNIQIRCTRQSNGLPSRCSPEKSHNSTPNGRTTTSPCKTPSMSPEQASHYSSNVSCSSPVHSAIKSPDKSKSPEKSRSPNKLNSPEKSKSPEKTKSPERSKSRGKSKSPEKSKSEKTPASKQPCRTPSKSSNTAEVLVGNCSGKHSPLSSKKNGFMVTGCKCRSSDAVAIAVNASVSSADVETKTL